METDKNTEQEIDNAFKAIDAIKHVTVSPFFKDKTMQRLFAEKEETVKSWSWFTPQLQLATLVCVVLINVYTIKQIKSAEQNEAISSFASDYGLNTETESSFF